MRAKWFGLSALAVASLVAAGCGSGDSSHQGFTSDDGGDAAAFDAGTSADGGDGGTTRDAGDGGGVTDAGDGGTIGDGGDGGPLFKGHTGVALVAGGTVSTSPTYKMIHTTGQGAGDNATLKSTNHQIVGGVVGATQKP